MKQTFLIENKKFQVSDLFKNKITIKSHPLKYDVLFQKFNNYFDEYDVLLVDKNVAKLYNINHNKVFIVHANEKSKSINTVLKICNYLSQINFDKAYTLHVIGGGIVQDLGAFTSKIYKRGINWIYYPTTLLSQCDSCIGGKTALNFNKLKNQLALFSAPSKVIIDINFLETLSKRDILSGYGEIIKLFLIGGNYFLNQLEDLSIKRLIFNSLMIKKAIVEHDEFESNLRKSLNLGHSFGHVIESMTNFKISHGESVLLGTEIINKLYGRDKNISRILEKYTSLKKINSLDLDLLLKQLKTDKKVKNGIITFVVTLTPGNTVFIDKKIDDKLKSKLDEIFVN